MSPALIDIFRLARLIVFLLLLAALPLTFWYIERRERSWVKRPAQALGPHDAFFHGTIGTELMPLPVAEALPSLFPENFHPRKGLKGDWFDQFGFIRPSDHPEEIEIRDERLRELPVGWTISNYRQKSGTPSPVPFVGFTCAMCHTNEIRRNASQTGFLTVGPGNSSLNLFAYLDEFQQSILDEQRMTTQAVSDFYAKKHGQTLTLEQRAMIELWLRGIRKTMRESTLKYDDGPWGGVRSFVPEFVPTGPSRTQPFRTLVRAMLDRPGTSMGVYTKVAPIYEQSLQEWFQVDGSIRSENSRSAAAALAAGATADNLEVREIGDNVSNATEFTKKLHGPRYQDVFPDVPIDKDKATRGHAVYLQYCNACHGHPDEQTHGWVVGERNNEVVDASVIGTDPRRVNYKFREEVAQSLYEYIGPRHRFYSPRDEIRPGPSGEAHGYINKPLPYAFTRAPFLHNASVPTLAQLINLEPRPAKFWRGRNAYDPKRLGLIAPEPKAGDTPDPLSSPNPELYFLFDTAVPGNSNVGHDYPWRYRDIDAGWNEQRLIDLLEFLKTL